MLRNWTKSAAILSALYLLFHGTWSKAAVVWNSGNPTLSGFTTTFGNSPPGFAGFTPDSPSVGILTQTTSVFNNSRYVLPPAAATAELNHTNGWFAEWRVNSTFNAAAGNLHVSVLANDSFGGGLFGFFPTKIMYYDGSAMTDLTTYSAGFHTFRLTRDPAGTAFSLQIDGGGPIAVPNFAGFATTPGRFQFGDGTGSPLSADTDPNGGNALWDFVAINAQVPEPSSLSLLSMGIMGLMALRRHKR